MNSDARRHQLELMGVGKRADPGQENARGGASLDRDAKEGGIQVVLTGEQSVSTVYETVVSRSFTRIRRL